MYGHITLNESGGVIMWAQLGHGDVNVCEIPASKVVEIMGNDSEDYDALASTLTDLFCRVDYLGEAANGASFNRMLLRDAILQAISPGAPFTEKERIFFTF